MLEIVFATAWNENRLTPLLIRCTFASMSQVQSLLRIQRIQVQTNSKPEVHVSRLSFKVNVQSNISSKRSTHLKQTCRQTHFRDACVEKLNMKTYLFTPPFFCCLHNYFAMIGTGADFCLKKPSLSKLFWKQERLWADFRSKGNCEYNAYRFKRHRNQKFMWADSRLK